MSPASIEKPPVDADLAARRAAFLREAKRFEAREQTPAGEAATAEEARRAAVWFVNMEISTQVMVGAVEQADYRDGPPPAWAFPISLAFPHTGNVGGIGEVLVDARTGKVLADEAAKARIKADAHELARRAAP